MGFGGPVIKEGIILVMSIVTLQNYFGDLGGVCGKYPGWVKVLGPFDICHVFTQFTILTTYIETYGFWGPVIKEGIILVISIVTLQNYYGDLGEVCGKYPGWGKVPGPFYICHFSPSSLFYVRILRHIGFGGHVIKEGLVLVISIVTLQNYIGHLGDVCSKYPGWVKVPGPFDICHFFTQLTILFTYIETYGFWGSRYKRRYNFSYIDYYTPK